MNSKAQYFRLFISVLVIAIFFGVGWLLGKNKIGFFSFLPLTGGYYSTDVNGRYVIDNSGVTTDLPWGNNTDNNQNYYSPQLAELEEIYRNYITSITTRDYSAFTSSVNAKSAWEALQNMVLTGESTTGINLYKTGDLSGQSYFSQFAPALINFSIPQDPDYFTATRVQPIKSGPYEPYYYLDTKNNKFYFVNDQSQTTVLRVYFNIDYFYTDHSVKYSNHGYLEDGYVDYIFEADRWKILDQDWQAAFLKNSLISSGDLEVTKGSQIVNLNANNNSANLKDISINKNDVVRWVDLHGMILSNKCSDGISAWSSPSLDNATYQMSFTSTGTCSFSIVNTDNTITLTGNITVK